MNRSNFYSQIKLIMEHSFENKNTCDVFMNEVRTEDELLPELEEMGSFRTEGSRNP